MNVREFKVGDIISAYHTGWHRIEKIGPYYMVTPHRGEPYETAVFTYRKVLTPAGELCYPKATMQCDATYCEKWDEQKIQSYLQTQINFCTEISQKLVELLKGPEHV